MEAKATTAVAPGDGEAGELRRLDAAAVKLFRHGADVRMTVEGRFSVLKVFVVRAFPLSHPGDYVCLLDGGLKEVGLLDDPRALPAESRRIVEEEIERRYRIPVITRVATLHERFGTEEWEVETSHGRCRFTTRDLHDNTANSADGHLIITDVDGNRYAIRDLARLDAASRRLLAAHL
jgi:hypothetical protein